MTITRNVRTKLLYVSGLIEASGDSTIVNISDFAGLQNPVIKLTYFCIQSQSTNEIEALLKASGGSVIDRLLMERKPDGKVVALSEPLGLPVGEGLVLNASTTDQISYSIFYFAAYDEVSQC